MLGVAASGTVNTRFDIVDDKSGLNIGCYNKLKPVSPSCSLFE